ncbi:unnamed protein product, partial [Meganyctiphanes norvegica]
MSSDLKDVLGPQKERDGKEKLLRNARRFTSALDQVKDGSMYFDEDGDLAHEFYEEINPMKRGVKATMRRILNNLKPQGEVKLPFPCLNVDFPIIIYQDSI